MSLLFLIIASLLFLNPVTASAYATPEEVLFQNDFFFPPTNRDADERVRRQEEQRLARFLERQERDLAERNPEPQPSLEEVLASLADAIGSIEKGKELTPDERQDLRLLQRVERRQAPTPQNLNSGAPLAPTGAGTVVVVAAMAAAAMWTLKRARHL